MKKDENKNFKIIAKNPKARFNYSLLEDFEAGIVLYGSEVKSLRTAKVSILESYVSYNDAKDSVELINCTIPEYKLASNYSKHEEKRPRKLLLHKKEIAKIKKALELKGMSAVPLSIYFNHKGIVKLKIALAKGKKDYDKRATIKEKEWKLEKQKALKEANKYK